ALAGLSGALGDRSVLSRDLFARDRGQRLVLKDGEGLVAVVLVVGDGAGAIAFLGDCGLVVLPGLPEGQLGRRLNLNHYPYRFPANASGLDGQCLGARVFSAVMGMFAEPFDEGRTALTVHAWRLVLIAKRFFALADPNVKACDFAVAHDARFALSKRFALDGGIGQ